MAGDDDGDMDGNLAGNLDGGGDTAWGGVGDANPDVWSALIDDMVLRSGQPGMAPIGLGASAGYDPWNDLVGQTTGAPMSVDDLATLGAEGASSPCLPARCGCTTEHQRDGRASGLGKARYED